jgi:primosomal protein N' (replication factor Y)
VIAEVSFDAPLPHPYTYRVPAGWTIEAGQRVLAPLGKAARVGIVVGVRDGEGEGLKPLLELVDASPIVTRAQLDLIEWIAAETLSSAGSTSAALLPPPSRRSDRAPGGAPAEGPAPRSAVTTHAIGASDAASAGRDPVSASPRAGADSTSPRAGGEKDSRPEVLVGAGRERRLLELVAESQRPTLVLTAGVEAAARWAKRLEKVDRTVRLDSGVPDEARARAWSTVARGGARIAVGTRSALLAPLPPDAIIALVDEQEAAHKPPGPPRIHSRDLVLERARREAARLVFTAATPSVETWWRAGPAIAAIAAAGRGPWPTVSIADTRGILRREPLTAPVARALRETLAAGRRAFLGVTRLASALACDECGAIVRCAECAIALSYSRATATLVCRLCGVTVPVMDTCPSCRGRRLSPFGWGAERVEHAVRRRFPRAVIGRYEPDARGARAEAQRAAARSADVVIGTRGALKLFGPDSLGLAAFISPDQLLRLPDFRAGERALELVWSAAERVRPDGSLIIQSQTPSHPAFEAVAAQDLDTFYREEMKFRAELGYPPFRRLAVIAIDVKRSPATVDAVAAALRDCPDLVTYPPRADRRNALARIVVKGRAELPRILAARLAELLASVRARRGIIDVEVDPVEWQF